jgi:seryl-tRNA synthetase
MLDIKFVRENPSVVRDAIKNKKVPLDLDQLLAADQALLDSKKKLQVLQEEKNANAKKVPQAKPEERPPLIERGKAIGKEIAALGPEIELHEKTVAELIALTPQIPATDAPIGIDESENVERYKVGTLPEFSFPMKDHVALMDQNDWGELERITKVSGSRMYALKRELAQLEMAVIQMALDHLVSKGSILISVPSLVRESSLFGTGHFPTGKDQVYKLADDELYLSGTGEVPVNSLHSGEILKRDELPLRYAAYSPCFRREAGSAGRDVRGLMRVHQFNKVEQFVFCEANLEESEKWHKELLKTSEEIVALLELPYRVIEVCTGDMGAGKYRMHDLESWVPSEAKYRETHSCSSLLDWQSRRTSVRYRDANDVVRHAYTLNNTAIATPRVLIPILENHQQSDGSIYLPHALRRYMGGKDRIGGRTS